MFMFYHIISVEFVSVIAFSALCDREVFALVTFVASMKGLHPTHYKVYIVTLASFVALLTFITSPSLDSSAPTNEGKQAASQERSCSP